MGSHSPVRSRTFRPSPTLTRPPTCRRWFLYHRSATSVTSRPRPLPRLLPPYPSPSPLPRVLTLLHNVLLLLFWTFLIPPTHLRKRRYAYLLWFRSTCSSGSPCWSPHRHIGTTLFLHPKTFQFQRVFPHLANSTITYSLCSCGHIHATLTTLTPIAKGSPIHVGDPPFQESDFVLQFDGGAFRSLSVGGAGVVLWKHQRGILSFLDSTCIPLYPCPDAAHAEASGAAGAIHLAASHFPAHSPSRILVKGDNRAVIDFMTNTGKFRRADLQRSLESAHHLLAFRLPPCIWSYTPGSPSMWLPSMLTACVAWTLMTRQSVHWSCAEPSFHRAPLELSMFQSVGCCSSSQTRALIPRFFCDWSCACWQQREVTTLLLSRDLWWTP